MPEAESLLPPGRELAALEAVLFACGEPVETELLSRTLQIPAATLLPLLEQLRSQLDSRGGGIRLLRLDTAWQLCSNPAFGEAVRAVAERRRETTLSPAALEVLAVTAYNQPVTRAFLEQVRGVDSAGVVASLLEKGLIEERGRLDVPGRPMQFGTTAAFLRVFGLSSLDELPPIDPHGEQLTLTEPEQAEPLSP
ncbi:MAG: SMC-Scp complex subunit ScpB [Clostridia bacterium]|nr:SMC-Scp complex subunit ScpB [Clostridia bacterium]